VVNREETLNQGIIKRKFFPANIEDQCEEIIKPSLLPPFGQEWVQELRLLP